jgi:hypothetical protein
VKEVEGILSELLEANPDSPVIGEHPNVASPSVEKK